MKKFSDFNKRPVKKIFEQDQEQTLGNLPQNIQVTVQGTQGSQENQDTQVTVVQPDQNTNQEDQNQNQEKDQNQENENKGGDVNVITFFSKLFESREMAHVYHLQVRGEEGSYAKHMALGSFYDGVLGLIDDVIEIYQGQYGIVDGYDIIDTKETKSKDAVNYFEEVAEYIKHAKKCINQEDTHLHNIIDEIVALIYKTLYKLKFNK